MNKEHILPQDFRLSALWAGPMPDRSFSGHTLEELYLALCNHNHEFRGFERIGVDAGARMYTTDIREFRIEVGTLSLRDRMTTTSFEPFCERLLDLLGVVSDHLDCLPLFAPRVRFSAVWPSEHETDLRDVFGHKFVNIQPTQLETLDAIVRNTGITIMCVPREAEPNRHFRVELEPDMADRRQLEVSVDGHYHESVDELPGLAKMLRETFEFLTSRIGRFVESLAMD
jgi:hypothetical protein